MKIFKKITLFFSAAILLLSSVSPVFALPSSTLDAGGLFNYYDDNGDIKTGVDCVFVDFGDRQFAFTDSAMSNRYRDRYTPYFSSVSLQTSFDLDLVFYDAFFSAYSLAKPADIPTLKPKRWSDAKTPAVIYFDNDLQNVTSRTLDSVTEEKSGFYLIGDDLKEVSFGAAIVEEESGSFIGIVVGYKNSYYGLSVEYLLSVMSQEEAFADLPEDTGLILDSKGGSVFNPVMFIFLLPPVIGLVVLLIMKLKNKKKPVSMSFSPENAVYPAGNGYFPAENNNMPYNLPPDGAPYAGTQPTDFGAAPAQSATQPFDSENSSPVDIPSPQQTGQASFATPSQMGVTVPLSAVGETMPLNNFGETTALDRFISEIRNKPFCIVGKGGYFDNQENQFNDNEVLIGRDPRYCTLRYPLDTPGISKVHCILTWDGNTLTITDKNSTNGTFVNGIRLQPMEPHVLQHGDEFYLAEPANTFRYL